MTRNPKTKPKTGDKIIGTMTFQISPVPSHQCFVLGTDQMRMFQLLCAAARHAPHNPPTRACDELDGIPNHQVKRFQRMAAIRAQIRTSDVATFGSTRPEAIVLATALPMKAPTRLVTAASATACRGVSTLVATTVAMELAVSWKPLMYSNTNATKMTVKMRSIAGYQEFFRT